jgi:hypothetical protein
MSKSRYYLICIILADLAGIALSYLYGAIVPTWIGSWLPAQLGFLRTAALWLYQQPLLLLPHTWRVALMHRTALYWLCFTLLIHLWLLVLYLIRRHPADNLGEPYPGGPYQETVQNLFKSYRESMQRWKPKWALKTPTWRYYKRQDSSQPDIYWKGRILVIEIGMFAPERHEEFAIALARELMYYNSNDIWVKDILSYYPSGWLLPMFLSGLCMTLPAVLIKQYGWSPYWEKRTLVADRFAYLVGQGMLLFQQIYIRLRREDNVPQLRRDLSQDLQELTHKRDTLQEQINDHKARLIQKYQEERQRLQYNDYQRYGYDGTYHSSLFQPQQGQQTIVVPEDDTLREMRKERNQMNTSIADLEERIRQLTVQEQLSFAIRPMLEQRLEQLAGLLNTEWQWMQQRGIPVPANYQAIAISVLASSSIPAGMHENAFKALWGKSAKEEAQGNQTS